MALKIIEGVVAEAGEAVLLSSVDPATDEARTTGAGYAWLRLEKPRGRSVKLERVLVDVAMAACASVGAAGRFVFYTHQRSLVLCGYSDGERTIIASEAKDPAAIAADAHRTRAKRKIFFGGLMIATIILISFGIDQLRLGRRMLKDNPRPRRPSEAKIRRKLQR
jgi:hypothetical protein